MVRETFQVGQGTEKLNEVELCVLQERAVQTRREDYPSEDSDHANLPENTFENDAIVDLTNFVCNKLMEKKLKYQSENHYQRIFFPVDQSR